MFQHVLTCVPLHNVPVDVQPAVQLMYAHHVEVASSKEPQILVALVNH